MTSQRIIEGEEVENTSMTKAIDEELERWKERMCTEPGCQYLSVPGFIYCEEHLHGRPQRAPSWVLEALGFASTKPKNKTANDAVDRIIPVMKDAFVDATEEYMVTLQKNLIAFIASVESGLATLRGQKQECMTDEEIDQAISNMEKAFDEAKG